MSDKFSINYNSDTKEIYIDIPSEILNEARYLILTQNFEPIKKIWLFRRGEIDKLTRERNK
jgi:hypothetical protein